MTLYHLHYIVYLGRNMSPTFVLYKMNNYQKCTRQILKQAKVLFLECETQYFKFTMCMNVKICRKSNCYSNALKKFILKQKTKTALFKLTFQIQLLPFSSDTLNLLCQLRMWRGVS